jgi:transcriptional regulator with XRE-family HTH domain
VTTLAERIVAIRTERGISQRKLADAASISRSYLCDLEKGRGRHPTWSVVERIAAVLDVAPMELQVGITPDHRSQMIRTTAGDLYAALSEAHRLIRKLEALGLS